MHLQVVESSCLCLHSFRFSLDLCPLSLFCPHQWVWCAGLCTILPLHGTRRRSLQQRTEIKPYSPQHNDRKTSFSGILACMAICLQSRGHSMAARVQPGGGTARHLLSGVLQPDRKVPIPSRRVWRRLGQSCGEGDSRGRARLESVWDIPRMWRTRSGLNVAWVAHMGQTPGRTTRSPQEVSPGGVLRVEDLIRAGALR